MSFPTGNAECPVLAVSQTVQGLYDCLLELMENPESHLSLKETLCGEVRSNGEFYAPSGNTALGEEAQEIAAFGELYHMSMHVWQFDGDQRVCKPLKLLYGQATGARMQHLLWRGNSRFSVAKGINCKHCVR